MLNVSLFARHLKDLRSFVATWGPRASPTPDSLLELALKQDLPQDTVWMTYGCTVHQVLGGFEARGVWCRKKKGVAYAYNASHDGHYPDGLRLAVARAKGANHLTDCRCKVIAWGCFWTILAAATLIGCSLK